MKKGFFLLPVIAMLGVSSVASAAPDQAATILKKGTAGPYQKSLVIINLKDYQKVPSVTVITTCSPKGIEMKVKTGLFQPGSEDAGQSIAGPYQEALVVLNLAHHKDASNLIVTGKCSPAGISMSVKNGAP